MAVFAIRGTLRRYYLDRFLRTVDFHGCVLDVGGKKEQKRGDFRPPEGAVESWMYLNTDPATGPDYLCSAESIPVESETFDMVLMTEVIEHLQHPDNVLSEVCRILKTKGTIVATMPFLYPVHADPIDFQRWTPDKIRSAFECAGFNVTSLEPMGSVFAVIYDLLKISFGSASKNRKKLINRILNGVVLPCIAKVVVLFDTRYAYKSRYITTGYFIEAVKTNIGRQ